MVELQGVPRRKKRLRQSAPEPLPETLHRVIWRWHFYAGLIIAPVLLVIAATGATYIFKDELEPLIYPQLMTVIPLDRRIPYDDQLASVRASFGDEFRVMQVEVPANPKCSVAILGVAGKEFRRLHFNPYSGELLGELGKNNLFSVVLRLHRSLFAGTTGRIITELTTCWTIILLVSGLYLWWPRKRWRLWGVFLPRLWRHPYVILRDLHAVCGFFVLAVAPLIAGTGLLYTYIWGSGYGYAAVKSGAYDIFLHPPQSRSAAEAPRLSVDAVVTIAAGVMPGRTLTVRMPSTPEGAYVVFGNSPRGPSSDGVVVIDHATGEVLMHRANRDYPTLSWWATWNYPLHVGSILGLPTKILWLVACLILMLLPITGVWMWWKRRPSGRTGFPRRPEIPVPRFLVFGIIALGVVLPALGLSIVAILAGEKAVSWMRWTRRSPTSVA